MASDTNGTQWGWCDGVQVLMAEDAQPSEAAQEAAQRAGAAARATAAEMPQVR